MKTRHRGSRLIGPQPNRALAMAILVSLFAIAAILRVNPTAAQVGAIERFGFEIMERVAQPRENFVQGLQIVDDSLYVSTGGYGTSRLREYAFPSMQLRRDHVLPEAFFGEGATRLGKHIYQLTWRAGQILIYDAETFDVLRSAAISTEGWGITTDGQALIYSDGSHRLYWLDPDSLKAERELSVTLNGRPLPQLNELEWINGEIWANVWRANQLVRINPETGAVNAIIDLRGLLDPGDRTPDTDVLNGIAWDAAGKALWVTGKRWPWIFKIRLLPYMPGAAAMTGPANATPAKTPWTQESR